MYQVVNGQVAADCKDVLRSNHIAALIVRRVSPDSGFGGGVDDCTATTRCIKECGCIRDIATVDVHANVAQFCCRTALKGHDLVATLEQSAANR
jgi:hypothetical protein